MSLEQEVAEIITIFKYGETVTGSLGVTCLVKGHPDFSFYQIPRCPPVLMMAVQVRGHAGGDDLHILGGRQG